MNVNNIILEIKLEINRLKQEISHNSNNIEILLDEVSIIKTGVNKFIAEFNYELSAIIEQLIDLGQIPNQDFWYHIRNFDLFNQAEFDNYHSLIDENFIEIYEDETLNSALKTSIKLNLVETIDKLKKLYLTEEISIEYICLLTDINDEFSNITNKFEDDIKTLKESLQYKLYVKYIEEKLNGYNLIDAIKEQAINLYNSKIRELS